MKQRSDLFALYFELLKKHSAFKHLVGAGTGVELLWGQSLEALDSLGLGSFDGTLVDIGAGQGILGAAALEMFESAKVLLVEPDRRKAAFLIDLKIHLPAALSARLFVEPNRIETVSRETITRACPTGPRVLLARAFSSNRSLKSAIEDSVFSADPAFEFVYNEQQQKFVFRPLK